MDSNAVEIVDLKYTYKSGLGLTPVQALRGISLSVRQGESFGFLGHNGAGKTTTIKCLVSLIHPTSGSVKIFGKSPTDPGARAAVGYLPEQPYFYDYLTVQELLEMYASLYGLPRAKAKAAIVRALDLVKVSAKSKAPMRSLSKGLTQRVGMAQAILAEPKLLVLDEPFSGLDPIGRKEFYDLLKYLKSIGTTIFISSHVLSDIQYLCDRVSIMAHGEIRGVFDLARLDELGLGHYSIVVHEQDRISQILSNCKLDSTGISDNLLEIRLDSKDKADAALSKLINEGVSIESYNFVNGSLEDLFVRLVRFEEQSGGVS